MQKSQVLDYLQNKTWKFTLRSIVEKVAPVHVLDNTEFYSTTDLKNLIVPELYRKMECSVTTFIYNPKFDQSPINPSK